MRKILSSLCALSVCFAAMTQAAFANEAPAVKKTTIEQSSKETAKEMLDKQYMQIATTYLDQDKLKNGIYSIQTQYLPKNTFIYRIMLNGEQKYFGYAENVPDISFDPSVDNEFIVLVNNTSGAKISQRKETWMKDKQAFSISESLLIDDLPKPVQQKVQTLQGKPPVKKEEGRKVTFSVGQKKVKVTENGEKKKEYNLNQPIQVINNQTMIPLHGILDQFGTKVRYNGQRYFTTIDRGASHIILYTNDKRAIVNGDNVSMPQPLIKKNGVLLIPARFIAEKLGLKVTFNPKTKEISIQEVK